MEHADINNEEYSYFLGQTLPFHTKEYSKFINTLFGEKHPLLDPKSSNKIWLPSLSYLLDSDRKPVSWSTDDKDTFKLFLSIGQKLRLLPKVSQHGQIMVCEKYPGIKPIIHQDGSKHMQPKERTHTDD